MGLNTPKLRCGGAPGRALLLLLLALLALPAGAAQRIVSINLCLDQLLLQLVARERIQSLTRLSANPALSPVAGQLQGIYLNRGLAEELVPLQPDLVLAGDFGAGDAVKLLRQLDFRVEQLPWPRTLDEITEQFLQLGQLLGAQAQARARVEAIEQRLVALDAAAAQRAGAEPVAALWYTPNGVVAGAGTLEHELMTRAGYRNLAAAQGLQGFRQMDLEQLVGLAPELIILEGGYVESFSLAGEYLAHPALRRINARLLSLPASLSVCSAPVVAEVIALLQQSLPPVSDTVKRED